MTSVFLLTSLTNPDSGGQKEARKQRQPKLLFHDCFVCVLVHCTRLFEMHGCALPVLVCLAAPLSGDPWLQSTCQIHDWAWSIVI